MKSYKIGDKEYELKSLAFGQWQQLIEIEVDDLHENDGKILIKNLLKSQSIFKFFAIALNEKGVPLWDKDIEQTEKELRFTLLPDQIGGIVTDFLELSQAKLTDDKTLQAIMNVNSFLKNI